MLPSPEKLKRRIILKHKKLPEGSDDLLTRMASVGDSSIGYVTNTAGGGRGFAGGNFDIANSVKNGILNVQEGDSGEWKPHFFVLTETKMFFSEVSSRPDQDEEEDSTVVGRAGGASSTDVAASGTMTAVANHGENDGHSKTTLKAKAGAVSAAGPEGQKAAISGAEGPDSSKADEEQLHYSEAWFYPSLQHGRSKAEELLKQNSHLGDGTFLVRPSETFVGAYSLSFLRKGQVRRGPSSPPRRFACCV